MTAQTHYEFGLFRLDAGKRILLREGEPVPLPPKVFDTLLRLIENRGRLVTKDDLLRQIWGKAIVEEGGLARNISILRKALGERPDDHEFIVTAPGRGYRFVADVRQISTDGLEGNRSPPLDSDSAVRPPNVDRRRLWVAGVAVCAPLLILASRSLPIHSSSGARSLERFKLTTHSGLDTHPTLSRDGALLAYASDRSGAEHLDIWVQIVGSADAMRRTYAVADETEPSFSPDGSEIVFSRRDSGIYVMGALHGDARLVARVPWGRTPRFSPDGKWIIYWTGFPPAVVAGGIPHAVGNMWIVSSNGVEAPRRIETPLLASARYPIWSPDSEYLLFLGEEDAYQKIFDWYVIGKHGGTPVKTGAVRNLQEQGLGTGLPIPTAWAHDRTVLFATNEAETSNIWRVRVDPATARASDRGERLTHGTALERNPALSQSGRIAFENAVENIDVWRLPIDANTATVSGELQRVTDSTAADSLRNVSEDGKILTFISSRTGRDEVWQLQLDRGDYRRLTFAGAIDTSASPDGRRVAFSRTDGARTSIEILDTTDALPVVLRRDAYGPSDWSRDGGRLLYGVGLPERSTAVAMHDFRSGREVELARHDEWGLFLPRFSPDGRWIAFHAAPSPNERRIYAVPTSPGGPVPFERWVAIVEDHGCHPNWSPDGRWVYYFSFRDGHFCLYAQQVDSETMAPIGSPQDVLHLHRATLRASSGVAAYNDVRADYVYMTLTETKGNVWMLE